MEYWRRWLRGKIPSQWEAGILNLFADSPVDRIGRREWMSWVYANNVCLFIDHTRGGVAMAREKETERMDSSLIEELRRDLMKEENIDCIILDIPISSEPDDPIRKVIDEVLGDFVEIPTPNGTFFFPTSILRS